MEQLGLSFTLLTFFCAGALTASAVPKLRARLASVRAKVSPAAEIAQLRHQAVAKLAVGTSAHSFLQMSQDLAFLHEALAETASPLPNAKRV
jgi:hypothetical protein